MTRRRTPRGPGVTSIHAQNPLAPALSSLPGERQPRNESGFAAGHESLYGATREVATS